MNSHGVVLDMQFDRLWFKPGACDHYDSPSIEFVLPPQFDLKRSSNHPLRPQQKSYDLPLSTVASLPFLNDQMMKNQKTPKKMMILQRSITLDKPMIHSNEKVDFANSSISVKSSVKLNVAMISTAVYHSFSRRYHKNKNYDFFFMSLYDINKILNYIEFRMSIRSMFEMKKNFIQKITLKKVNRLLSSKFKNLFQNFDFNLIEKLSSHRAYDHKIEFEKNFRMIKSQM